MLKKFILPIAGLLIGVGVFLKINTVEVNAPETTQVPINEKLVAQISGEFTPPSTDCTLLRRKAYTACYDEEHKVADWVSYKLARTDLFGAAKRKDNFKPDPDLSPLKRSELEDFRGSGYDRGHLAPAGDMVRDQEAMDESFLLTNMAPQTPSFNRGIWRQLESQIRDWVEQSDEAYHITTGPLYLDLDHDGKSDETKIGAHAVSVPTHFYKIVVTQSLRAIAFVMPNIASPTNRLDDYITTINEIESISGFDFLSELDDNLEEEIESARSPLWS